VPAKIDMLGVLDTWVDTGKAPDTLTQVSQQDQAPFKTIASRPMCRYPLSPRYGGEGSEPGGKLRLRKAISAIHQALRKLPMWVQIRNATTTVAMAAAVAALTLAQGAAAEAIETKVFSSAAPRGVLREIAAVFERVTGQRLVIEFAFAADLKRRIEAGNPFDVAILPPDMADELVRRDKLAAGSRVE
jgi:hypothetical protein